MRWWRGSVRRASALLALFLCPLSALAGGGTAFVTCQNGDALSVLDLDSATLRRTTPLPGEPAGLAVTDSAIFVVSAGSHVLRRLDAQGLRIEAELPLDGGPVGIVADPARGRVFVSDWYNARLWEIGADPLRVLATHPTAAAPAGLALSPGGRWLASADRDADAVTLFDLQDGMARRSVGVGVRPFGLAFAPDGRLFVANVGSNDVTVIAPQTGAVLGRVAVGARPYGVAFAAGRAFVSNQYADTVSVIDLATLAPLAEIAVGEYPEGIDTTADGRIVVANWFSNRVTVIDAETLTITAEIETADGPRAFGRFIRN